MKERLVQYGTYLRPDQAEFLEVLADQRGTKQTIVLRAAIDAYINECRQEVADILKLRDRALDGAKAS